MMDERERIAEAVKQACIDTALRAYEEGGISGLCAEGRWELAVDAMRNLDTKRLTAKPVRQDPGPLGAAGKQPREEPGSS